MTQNDKVIQELGPFGSIRPEDEKWLMFLFFADGVSRQAQYDWHDGLYWDAIKWTVLLYAVCYPIMFTWDSLRKIKERLNGLGITKRK